LAVPVTSDAKEAAKTFTTWATSKEYLNLVAKEHGVISTPPGTRKSTYANPEYMKQAPFAAVTLKEMNNADPTDSTLEENPYTGIQFVAIPRFQSFASKVGKQISSILSEKTSIERGLMISQKIVYRQMLRGKYINVLCVDNSSSIEQNYPSNR
jgi:sorbitol/mannitol transport system substrate-binding protein